MHQDLVSFFAFTSQWRSPSSISSFPSSWIFWFQEDSPMQKKAKCSWQKKKILFGALMRKITGTIRVVGHTPSPLRGFSYQNFTSRKQSKPSPSYLCTFAGITEYLQRISLKHMIHEEFSREQWLCKPWCACERPRTPRYLQEKAVWRGREIHAGICRDPLRQPTHLKN